MSRRGDYWDNAVMESFFATLKKEEADRFSSYSDPKMALVDYIEVFYNQRRRHSTLGQISPAAFERRAAAASVTTGRSPAATSERRMLIRMPPNACRLSSTKDDDTRST
jgi:hypothetical protein